MISSHFRGMLRLVDRDYKDFWIYTISRKIEYTGVPFTYIYVQPSENDNH